MVYVVAQAMRFKPWMLSNQPKANPGPWGALPPPALSALNSADQSLMVRRYLINGSWPRAKGTRPVLPAPEQKQEPQTNPQPELTTEHTTPVEASSLSLTIRVLQPTEEGTTPTELMRQQSRWRRLLRVIKRGAA